MTLLHLSLIELTVLLPLVGAAVVTGLRNRRRAQGAAVVVSALTLMAAVGVWADFARLDARPPHSLAAHDQENQPPTLTARDLFVVDPLSAPLLPLIALLHFLTILATQRTKLPRYSFALALMSEGLLLATFACPHPGALVVLLALGTIPPYLELRFRRKPVRVYVTHGALFVSALAIGWGVGVWSAETRLALFALAVLIRSGIIPFHCWFTDLFEHASFGTALLFMTPLTGAYAALRLLITYSPEGFLSVIGVAALLTAVYAAAMALVQREARRSFCYLLLSHSALVLVGLHLSNRLGLAGGLCVWLSTALAFTGLGLTLRAVEARFGRLSLDDYRGLYEHVPALASSFAISGLAAVGFPFTVGFIGTEMLVEGVVEHSALQGAMILATAALNGITLIRVYFLLFAGRRHFSTIALGPVGRERFTAAVLAVLLVGGGLYPQPGVASRHEAAVYLLSSRSSLSSHFSRGQFSSHRFAWNSEPPPLRQRRPVVVETTVGISQSPNAVW
jgi:NADH-quinone oxidoreductase subunit M